MNQNYRVDKQNIIVTDDKGVERKLPKYEHIEEILKTEDAVEVMSEMIAGFDEELYDIQHEQAFIDYDKINRKFYNYLLLVMLMVLSGGVAWPFILPLGIALFGGAIVTVCKWIQYNWKLARSNSLKMRNDELLKKKSMIEVIKENYMEQLAELQESINPAMMETPTKPAIQDSLRELRTLRDVLIVIQDDNKTSLSQELQQIIDVLQGTETQKELIKRFGTGPNH